MAIQKKLWLLFAWIAFSGTAIAQGPGILNYQGRMAIDGKPFNGQGFFTFVVLDERGAILWSSGEFPYQGSTKLPAKVLKLPVNNGAYSARLGDTTAGMPALDIALLRRSGDPKLRIWFNDGTRGWQVAGDDVSLAPALGISASPAGAMANSAQTEAILRELKDLRARLDRQQQPAPQPRPMQPEEPKIVTVSTAGSPSNGRADAPLVLVEFTDYQCGFCKRFHDTTMPELVKNYVDAGKLKIVSRNLALSFHDQAEPAAQAALCAQEQQKFWPMRDRLFAINATLSPTNIFKAAETLKLDMAAFQKCMDGKNFAKQVARDGQDAGAAGITGTPTFVLGRQNGDNVTGMLIVGAKPFAAFDAEIKKMLASPK